MVDTNLSVYIVTYNRCNYLKKTIKSVLDQTYNKFVIYILDNNSNDKTKEIVSEFSDPRIHYICHKKNIGGINNIRFALENCTTDYCVVFHDDDIMRPAFIERELSILEEHKDVDMVSTNAYIIDEKGTINGQLLQDPTVDGNYTFWGKNLIVDYINQSRFLVFPSIMYRMNVIKDNNIFPQEEAGPGCDIVFNNEILSYGGKACEIHDCLMEYRMHPEQDTYTSKLYIDLKMFTYMKSNPYFAGILQSEEHNIYKVYSKNTKQALKVLIKDKSRYKEVKELINEYSNCWIHPIVYDWMTKIGLFLIKITTDRLLINTYSLWNKLKEHHQ